jgi:hypothetical protein
MTTYHPPPEERPSPSSSLNGDTSRLLDKLVLIGSMLAMLIAIVVMVLGAVAALIDNSYDVGDYLNDLRALVLGLAAVLIALELPAAIHGRSWRRRNDRGF